MKKETFPKEERLTGKKNFDDLYSKGITLFSINKIIKATFLVINNQKPDIKIAVAVSKKAGTAVWRNRLKRLMKESFRKNKQAIIDFVTVNNLVLYLVFSPGSLNQKTHKNLKLFSIEIEVKELINKIVSSSLKVV